MDNLTQKEEIVFTKEQFDNLVKVLGSLNVQGRQSVYLGIAFQIIDGAEVRVYKDGEK